MKTKCFVFLSCLAAGALIASPAMGKPAKKSAGHSSRQHRMAARTTQVTPTHRYNQGRRSSTGNARYYSGTRYSGARSYAGHRYSSTGYYSGTPRYKATTYYGGSRSYYNGGSYPYYSSYYSGRPYSNWGYGTSWGYYPYSYWGGYPYSCTTTTTTRPTRRATIIMDRRLQLCSVVLANSVTTMAQSMESSDPGPAAPSRPLKVEMAS